MAKWIIDKDAARSLVSSGIKRRGTGIQRFSRARETLEQQTEIIRLASAWSSVSSSLGGGFKATGYIVDSLGNDASGAVEIHATTATSAPTSSSGTKVQAIMVNGRWELLAGDAGGESVSVVKTINKTTTNVVSGVSKTPGNVVGSVSTSTASVISATGVSSLVTGVSLSNQAQTGIRLPTAIDAAGGVLSITWETVGIETTTTPATSTTAVTSVSTTSAAVVADISETKTPVVSDVTTTNESVVKYSGT